jgi:flotillin
MINNGTYQEIAKTNALAVRDLQPKISVWNHGGEQGIGGASGSGMKDIAGLYKMLPPVLDTVYEQTGMQPPAWIGTLSK